MSDPKSDTAAHFSRRAEAYAASPSHARGADLEIVAKFANPGPADRCLVDGLLVSSALFSCCRYRCRFGYANEFERQVLVR